MARKGRVDRGLVMRRDASGKAVWVLQMISATSARSYSSIIVFDTVLRRPVTA